MNTYWVTDKKVHEGGDEPVLNPFQRLRLSPKPALVPSSPPATTPPPTTQQRFFPQTRVLPKVFPKPDEWPEADRRLSTDTRQRSGTLPTLEVPARVVPHPRTTRHGSLNHIVAPPSLLHPTPSDTGTPRLSVTRDTSRSNSIISVQESEYNLLRLRESIALQLPTISEAVPSQLAIFAAAAEENARNARRLADWAAELARAAARRESSVDVGFPLLEGTPVDSTPASTRTTPPPKTEDSSGSRNHSKYSCKMM